MSDQATPFIPPLGTPHPPSPHPRMNGSAGYDSGRFPSGGLSYSPQTSRNTGYLPPGHYTPSGYGNLPLGIDTSGRPPVQPGGLSADYTGYPNLTPTPQLQTSNTPLPPTPGSQRQPEPSPMWPGPGSFGTPYHPPMHFYPGAPGPYHTPFIPPMGTPFMTPGAWPLPPHQTPYQPQQPPLPGGPPPPVGPPPFQGYPPAAMFPGYPMYPGMIPPPAVGPYDMAALQTALGGPAAPPGTQGGPFARAGEPGVDRLSPWAVGRHYGPVLEPFLTHILNVKPMINPLLLPHTPDADRPYLKWNMLFASNMCQRSGDATHVSWNKGRNEPATFPRVTRLTLVPSLSTGSLRNAAATIHGGNSQQNNNPLPTAFLNQGEQTPIPFMIPVHASKREVGVTCGDVIDGIYMVLCEMSGGKEFSVLPERSDLKRAVAAAYRHNRSRAPGVPGGSLGDGLRKMDWLCLDVWFGGIRFQGCESTIRKACGFGRGGTFNNTTENRIPEDDYPADNPCTYELLCVRRTPMTREEAEQEAAEERVRVERSEAEERDRATQRDRRRSRADMSSSANSSNMGPPFVARVDTETDSSSVSA
ncbi:hypothetical protein E1B28_002363 [Marasmius oreades]|uniref:DUF6699 domain-containing protein n=1 Tax=Marasmius oreades TaxID=181124 RepID=A0A9P7RNF8_9AGAR|nr:uncharacterized protein E1B28_002363 [Marasmius oreades]KAG7086408.1 hypothetical protein E1B28_002363 [Marasmius oreades]